MLRFLLVPDNMSPIKVYETVVDWEYEQKCTTSYEEECHGYGYHQECEKVICFVLWQIYLVKGGFEGHVPTTEVPGCLTIHCFRKFGVCP